MLCAAWQGGIRHKNHCQDRGYEATLLADHTERIDEVIGLFPWVIHVSGRHICFKKKSSATPSHLFLEITDHWHFWGENITF